MKTKILVAGATGYLGGHVVRALHARGYPIRALARSEARLGEVRALCDEVVVAEATRPETLIDVVGGAGVLFSALGKHDFERRPTAREIDYRANINLLERARDGGVEYVVFVSVIHGAALRDRGIASVAAREDVVDAIKASGLSWTIIRPTGFFNDMKDFFQMAAKGTGWVVGDGTAKMNPIHGADLADFIAAAIDDPTTRGRELEVGGPDELDQREMLGLAFEALGKPTKLRRLPPWVLRASAVAVSAFNPFVADLMRSIAVLGEEGAVAPAYGTHHLAEFYRELAATNAEP